jgi:hypothetical protein
MQTGCPFQALAAPCYYMSQPATSLPTAASSTGASVPAAHGTPCSSTLPSTPRSQATHSCSWVISMPRQGACRSQQTSRSSELQHALPEIPELADYLQQDMPARKYTDDSSNAFGEQLLAALLAANAMCIFNGRVAGANDGYTCFSSSGAPGRAPPRPSTEDYAAGSIDLLGSVQAMNIHDTAESDHSMLSISLHWRVPELTSHQQPQQPQTAATAATAASPSHVSVA